MSRLELGGKGDPIPLIALPDPNLDDNLTPQVFALEDGVPFVKTDWVGLGYTHYEVWCIGAAGGRGGGISNQAIFLTAHHRPVMTSGEWSNYLALMHYYNDPLGVVYTKWDPNIPGEVVISMEEWYQLNIPNHDPWYVNTFRSPFLSEDTGAIGGAGGGGGIHVMSGELATLPEACDVEVGVAGAETIPPGQTFVNGAWTPLPYSVGGTALQQWATEFMNEYPNPHPSFLPPQVGQDGGASTFGGDICQASGGKGGAPAKKWVGGSFVVDGSGGEGGVGSRTLAGGGAPGSNSPANGSDGTWDGTIGQGGGGGRGGRVTTSSGFPPTSVVTPPTDGGRGSFSYADTSIFGDRQQKSNWVTTQYIFDYVTGNITSVNKFPTTNTIIPGGGGGAKALHKMNYGSRAVSFNPNGLVVIRLTAVVE